MIERMPDVGEQLGRFKLESKLGQGSLGIVFLAHDSLLNIKVALKVLNPFMTEGKASERLSREVLLARKVAHPGVCRIFDIHQENELYFITMEHIEGPTLEAVLAERKMIEADRAVRLGSHIAHALSAAHDQAVIHRGLTPRNVILRSGDRISILDFGLAKTRDFAGTTGASAPLEAIYYMSPEVLMAQPSAPQSDIYSLGAILYRCVTGSVPFQGNNAVEVTNAVLGGKLVPPRLFNPNIAPPLEKLISKAMALKPDDRYLSMREFREWLAVLIDGSPEPSADGQGGEVLPLWHANIDIGAPDASEARVDTKTQQIPMRDTTILFSDIVGSTKYFDKHGDMAGRKWIQKHNEMFFPVIQRHSGTVLKTIGDAIMAFFDNPSDGVEAAMEMQQILESANRLKADEQDKTQIRIGLHSGQCIIENQDVFGDAVNVAARICSKAGAREILVSSFTREKLGKGMRVTRFHSATALKGKTDDFRLFAVQWDRPLSPAPGTHGADDDEAIPTQVGTVAGTAGGAASGAARASPGGTLLPPPIAGARTGGGSTSSASPSVQIGDATLATEVGSVADAVAGHEGDTRDTLEMQSPFATGAGQVTPREMPTPVGPLPSSSGLVSGPAGLPMPPFSVGAQPTPQVVQPTQPPVRATRPALYIAVGAALGTLVMAAVALLILQQTRQESPTGTDRQGGPAVVSTGPAQPADAGPAEPESRDASVTGPIEQPDPVPPEVDDPSGTGRPRVASASSAQVQLARLKKSISTSMGKKGVITGDNAKFDAELRKMTKLGKRAKYLEALASGKRAQTLLAKIQVDKAFVEAKLTRFNRLFDSAGDGASASKVMDLAQDIVTAMESGHFSRANRLLNRSFRILNKNR